MSSTIGNLFKVNVFGESHGSHIGVTITGVPSGMILDFDFIDSMLEKRRGLKEISTTRQEKDQYQIISGYFNGKTTHYAISRSIISPNSYAATYSTLEGAKAKIDEWNNT